MYKVFYKSRFIRRWRQCGEHLNFTEANELVDYLMKSHPCGKSLLFRITSEFKSYDVSELDRCAG